MENVNPQLRYTSHFFTNVDADIEYVPAVESAPANEHDVKNLKRLIDALEENDDVQKVYHNCSLDLED